MKLSPHWRRAWRRFSVQSLGWSLAGLVAWPNLPPDLKAEIPAQLAVWVLGALLALGLVGSVIDQPSTRSHSDEPPRP